jgi:hypothetical protein
MSSSHSLWCVCDLCVFVCCLQMLAAGLELADHYNDESDMHVELIVRALDTHIMETPPDLTAADVTPAGVLKCNASLLLFTYHTAPKAPPHSASCIY